MSKGLLLHGFRHYTEHTEQDPINKKHTPTTICNLTHSGPNPQLEAHLIARLSWCTEELPRHTWSKQRMHVGPLGA